MKITKNPREARENFENNKNPRAQSARKNLGSIFIVKIPNIWKKNLEKKNPREAREIFENNKRTARSAENF